MVLKYLVICNYCNAIVIIEIFCYSTPRINGVTPELLSKNGRVTVQEPAQSNRVHSLCLDRWNSTPSIVNPVVVYRVRA